MEYTTIGKIINVRGLQGEVKIASLTDFPLLRYRRGQTVYLERNANQPYLPLIVQQYRQHQGFDYVQFSGLNKVEMVQDWINCYVYADKHAIRLKSDAYFFGDLKGLTVLHQDGQRVGVVKTIETIGTRPLLRMQRDGLPDVLIPFIKPFIVNVDLTAKQITVHFIEGMLA
jgi:16S rRNA processing protein RimM